MLHNLPLAWALFISKSISAGPLGDLIPVAFLGKAPQIEKSIGNRVRRTPECSYTMTTHPSQKVNAHLFDPTCVKSQGSEMYSILYSILHYFASFDTFMGARAEASVASTSAL